MSLRVLRVECDCGASATARDLADAQALVAQHGTECFVARVLVDSLGSRWPVSGFWCSVCGWPLHEASVLDGLDTHPGCDPTLFDPGCCVHGVTVGGRCGKCGGLAVKTTVDPDKFTTTPASINEGATS